jgi:hypothetical protein
MKKIIVALLLVFGMTGYTYSQGVHKTPEQKAKETSAKLEKDLSLTPEQTTQVYDATLAKIKASDDIRTQYASDKEAMRGQMKPVNEKYNTQMKSILTPEQFTQWKQLLEEEKKMKEKGHK